MQRASRRWERRCAAEFAATAGAGALALAQGHLSSHLGEDGSDSNEGNLKIWRVATGELQCSWQQKVLGDKSMWLAVNWSCDEEFCFKVVTNEVHFFDGGKRRSRPR